MSAPKPVKPLNWEDYERGRSSPRQGSIGSIRFESPPAEVRRPLQKLGEGNGNGNGDGNGGGLRHRRFVNHSYMR